MQEPKTTFTHLHTHSHYSLLNALPKIPDLIDEAKKNGMTALALTDNCNLYGAIEFYIQCKKKGVKPIIGIDAYVAYRGRHEKQSIDKERYRLVLLATNDVGYKNLIKLVTYAHLEGFYYKPRIDKELLQKYSEGLIAISPSIAGDITQSIMLSNESQAKERLDWYKSIFNKNGEENFYFEITHHPEIKNHEETMDKLVAFAKETKTPLVATHDVYYLHPEDREARQTLIAVASQNDEKLEFKEENFSFISPKEAEKYFKKTPEALQNIQKIVDRCNLEIAIGKWSLPNYIVESGLSHDDELRRITEEGINKRNLKKTEEIKERMEYELNIIKDKGYAPYFLVVSDLLRFAHENGILTTIRGSVAGSLVTYLSGITNVNPIEYNLPFERFLNPFRPSAPDIDMDFADTRRDEMIEYAKRKYGEDKVAQIGTFGTMAARGAVRDVTRALGYPYSLGDSISKLIPMGKQGFPMTIDRAINEEPELKRRYKEEDDVKKIINMAKKIEGCARHISVHAAGVVMAPTPLTDYVPLQYDTKGSENGQHKIITQYDMHSVGEDGVGLLKFDFLGIRNLSILADAVKRVKKIEGIDIDIENVPVDDKKTFEMLARGETVGLFQLNGDAMTQFLKQLKPTEIRDINVMVALYRPGPMKNIPEYIARKQGKKVTYLHPKMKKFLEESYGILVYQEDIMMTAMELAGYTWKTVDKLRKAIGKKIPKEMAEQHEVFVNGCIENSQISKEKAEEIWKLFEPFQGYGFNKAHAASYGKVAYQTAYMKANYPAIYMSAVLTAESGDVEMISEIINECKRMQIPVLPPDINKSFEGFGVVKAKNGYEADTIRFGLTTIKNFGEGIAHSIVEERKKNGEFTSLSDFLKRIKDKNLNKKSLESLIKTGAMDIFGDRNLLLHNLDRILQFNKEERQDTGDQSSLFSSTQVKATEIHLEDAVKASQADKLMWEKDLLGLYISGHPLDTYKHKLENREVNIKKVKETLKEKAVVVIGGIIEELRPVMTKKGEKMYFIKISDLTDSIEAVAFPKIITEENSDLFITENCVVIKGTVSVRDGQKSILVDKIKLME
ncbi:MAG: DNA polymerase III subunit alpha [Minisyncoccia bacterium]